MSSASLITTPYYFPNSPAQQWVMLWVMLTVHTFIVDELQRQRPQCHPDYSHTFVHSTCTFMTTLLGFLCLKCLFVAWLSANVLCNQSKKCLNSCIAFLYYDHVIYSTGSHQQTCLKNQWHQRTVCRCSTPLSKRSNKFVSYFFRSIVPFSTKLVNIK